MFLSLGLVFLMRMEVKRKKDAAAEAARLADEKEGGEEAANARVAYDQHLDSKVREDAGWHKYVSTMSSRSYIFRLL